MKYIVNKNKMGPIIELYLNKISIQFPIVENIQVTYDKNVEEYNINVFFDWKLSSYLGPKLSNEKNKALRELNNGIRNMFGGTKTRFLWYIYFNK